MLKRPYFNPTRRDGESTYAKQLIVQPNDAAYAEVLGYFRYKGVALTVTQVRELSRVYGYSFETKSIPRDNPDALLQAGSFRNLCREVEMDGLRAVALMSKFLSKEEDPVKFLHDLMISCGYDLPCWDEEPDEESVPE